MAETFTWLPDDRPSGRHAQRISKVEFGEGYKQIAKDGLNTKKQTWPLSFDRDQEEIDEIEEFLDQEDAAPVGDDLEEGGGLDADDTGGQGDQCFFHEGTTESGGDFFFGGI